MVGTAQQVVGQQPVVAAAVAVEVADVGLHVGRAEGTVAAVKPVDAVEAMAHGAILTRRGAAGEQKDRQGYGQQVLHCSNNQIKY